MLVLKEILYRKLNFILALLALVVAVSLFVSFFSLSQALKRETIRLTRDMGFNLRIISDKTDMNEFWLTGYSDNTMPQDYLKQLISFKDISYAHLTATLYHKIVWNDQEVILTGISPEFEPSGRKKTAMLFSVAPGTVYIGYQLAKQFNLQPGDSIELEGTQMKIAKTLAETGTAEDIKIYLELSELQILLHMENKVNEIKAINCLCLAEGVDPIDYLREQLEEILPQTQVVMNKTIAQARKRQRHTIDNYFSMVLPVIIFVCLIWVGVLAMINVNERKKEIGIYKALGFQPFNIAWLFISKSLILGIVASLIGFGLGNVMAFRFGPRIFKITGDSMQVDPTLLWWSLLVAPLCAMIATLIPALLASFQDPAKILRLE